MRGERKEGIGIRDGGVKGLEGGINGFYCIIYFMFSLLPHTLKSKKHYTFFCIKL